MDDLHRGRLRGRGGRGAAASPELVQSTEYMARVEALTGEDEQLLVKFLETVQLTRSPDWLMDSELVSRINDNWDRLGTIVAGARPSAKAQI